MFNASNVYILDANVPVRYFYFYIWLKPEFVDAPDPNGWFHFYEAELKGNIKTIHVILNEDICINT